MTADEEAAACKVATSRLEVIEMVLSELREEEWYRQSTHRRNQHEILRRKLGESEIRFSLRKQKSCHRS